MRGKYQEVHCYMPAALKARIMVMARKEMTSVSSLIRSALLKHTSGDINE